MINPRPVGLAVALAVTLSGAAWAAQAGKALPGAEAGIAQLVADTNGAARVSLHDATGTARFVRLGSGAGGAQGSALKAPAGIAAESQESSKQDESRAFLARHGQVFGIRDSVAELVEAKTETDALGGTHITYEQRYRGLPVFAGELKAHFSPGGELTVLNGTFVPDIDLDPTAAYSGRAASSIAIKKVQTDLGRTGLRAIRSELLVFRAGLAKGVKGPNHLAWKVEVGNGGDVREFVFIDAHNGKFIEQFTGIHDALNRRAFDGNGSTLTTPPNYPGTPFWLEGSVAPGILFFPTGNTEADNMIYASKETYDFFNNAFGRDSFDGLGATMDAIFNRGNACPNASWNGTFISFCPGLTSDDVTGHEWSHAYTEYTHNLIYAWQPGALNESYSDIFGETIDRINARDAVVRPNTPRTAGACSIFTSVAGTDNSERWLLGEDDTGALAGALRDMWNPNCYSDPGKVSDVQYTCDVAFTDQGGVHTNSGVPNHAYALLVDGGVYNSQTVTSIGLTKAAHIYFRAQSVYQGPASDFTDHADALEQSCSDLIGVNLADLSTGAPSGQVINASDCTQVTTAILAVELRSPPSACAFPPILAPNPPNRCEVGSTQTTALFEDFELGSTGWTVSNLFTGTGFTPRNWVRNSGLPDARPGFAFFGDDPNSGTCSPGGDESGVLHLDSPSVVLPLGAAPRMTFDHWVSTEATWDGGNVSISVNGGPFTLIARADYTFNPYNLTALQTTAQGNSNPLQGQPAFSGTDAGSVSGSWGRSHVNLAPYALPGDTVQIRFDLGSDGCGGSFGWYIDDVSLHACLVAGPEIAVSGNGVDIVDGDVTPSIADSTDFGIVNIAATTVARTFTVQNLGTGNLTLSTPTISGPNAADFTVTLAPTSPVLPLGSTTFEITFDPSASGPRSATVSFANDDPNENPFDFSIAGTGTAGSATCAKTALLNSNSTSGNARAPQTRTRFARSVYLIKASELAAAGFVAGSTPTTIGWNYQTGGTAGSAPLVIYLQNTADTTNTKSTTWATAIGGMTVVHNATTALPAAAGPFDINLTGGSAFTYTGGGIYVAFDWGQYTGTLGTTTVVWCDSTGLAGGLLGAQSLTAAPTTLGVSNFRPETRLNGVPTAQSDAAVTAVMSYGELPFGNVPAQSTRAVITNLGAGILTNVPVTLNITGADTFTDTQIIPTVAACGGQGVVTFAPFTPGALGSDTVTASVPADDIPGNNSLSRPLNITASDYSYKYPGSTATSGVGLTGATGAFVGKFTTTTAASVAAVKLEFNATPATTYRVAIYGDSGSGTPSTTALYLDAADRAVTAVGPVTITLPAPVAVGPGNFFVGIQQTNTINTNLSYDAEAPIRTAAFYLATPNPPGAWFDFAPNNSFKLNIGLTLVATPTVTSPTSALVTDTTATLGGNVTSDNGSPITGRGVVYAATSTNPNPQIGGAGVTQVAAGTGTGVFTTGVTGLLASTGYSFRAYATNAGGPGYTSVAAFTTCPTITLAPLSNGIVNASYSGAATASGGSGSYTYSLTSGALPTGLTLNPGTGALTTTPTAVGTFNFQITATDTAGPGTCTGSRSYSVVIGSSVAVSDLVIREFRLRGPAGPNTATDEYVVIHNRTAAPITVASTDGSTGFAVASSDGNLVFTIPNGTLIAPRGFFLGANTAGYSLGGTHDASWTTDIADGLGLGLFKSATSFTGGNALDAVGFTGGGAPYIEGAGLTSLGAVAGEYAWVRKAPAGPVQDTGANATDFMLVATDGLSYNGVQSILGAPSPTNSSLRDVLSGLLIQMAEPLVGPNLNPNRIRTGVLNSGTLQFRRRIHNNTGGTITAIRLRVNDLSTLNSPGYSNPAQADLRPGSGPNGSITATSIGVTALTGLNLLTPPAQAIGGGVNSVLLFPVAPLLNGASIDINIVLNISRVGSYRFFITVEAQ